MENNKENKTFEQGDTKEVLIVLAFGVVAFIALVVIAHFVG